MLTENQINHLYKFCVQHYVRYYDVQIELVDHLANAIEEKMEADKNLDFESALSNVYTDFGRMGFSKIVSQKTEAANKNIRKIRWQYFKEFFTIPKIAVTILLLTIFIAIYYLVNKQYITTVFILFASICIGLGIGFVIYAARKYKKPKKELLCLKGESLYFSFGLLCQVPNYYNMFIGHKQNNTPELALHPAYYFIAVAFCIFAILLSLASMKTYMKIEDEALKNYPLAFQ